MMEVGKRLVKEGHRVVVISEGSFEPQNKNKSGKVTRSEINGIHYYHMSRMNDNWFKKFHIWKWVWKNRKLIKEADIVHCHDVFFWYFPFRFLYPTKRVFTTFHGYEGYPLKRRAVVMRKISEKMSFGNICIGDFISKWYGTHATIVSYGGVDGLRQGQSGSYHTNSALFYGRLDEQTGILDYVEAVQLVKRKLSSFELLVIGEGKYKELIKNKVKLFKFQNKPEILLKNHHYAFLSRYLSMLEAMIAHRLVFAVYDNPIKEDYLKLSPFADLIIICRGSNDLSSKITYYLSNPTKEHEIVEKAYEWAKKQTWEKVVDDYKRLWNI